MSQYVIITDERYAAMALECARRILATVPARQILIYDWA